jgi:hypothetical protein
MAIAAGVYAVFSPDDNQLGVKPVDDNQASMYQNKDHAARRNITGSTLPGARGAAAGRTSPARKAALPRSFHSWAA